MLEEPLSKILKVEPQEIQNDWKIGLAPNWDSFAQMEIILMLEEQFDLKIDDTNFELSTSVSSIKHLLWMKSRDLIQEY